MDLIQYFRFKVEFNKVKVNREVVGEYFADYPNRTKDTIENYIGINNADLKKVIKELGYNASDILNSMKEREYIWTDRKGFSKVMNSRMDNKKVNLLYTQFSHIDKVGLFFPVYINELNFLGEKIFGTAVNKSDIFEEVNRLAGFLNNYSNRKQSQDIISEFTGNHCKFAIRIVGKK